MKNAESLEAVHTHTPILIQGWNSSTRESKRVEKTCSVCDAQKIEEIEKGFNIKLGYFEMEKFISNIAELFVLQRSD